ncbi:helix-turn-helix domain-containing protein [Rhizobium leguminosarum bv. viciae 248]|uniref:helix-turn-helix domain-containing protein n=1 Tax=Rhizobium leguminosarum TaxID=384 RepID=UPI000373B934|nr:helix-turn-helix domain-containing protein [Rhizobium leguminosarum]QHW26625.1 helix-turn-helix domain-containing protein [Rhizobium leguminosarum bv. viciae 248]
MEKLTAYLKAERGRLTRLADRIGVNPSAISQWKSVPVDHLAEVEEFTGIPRAELLPEAFRAAREAAA